MASNAPIVPAPALRIVSVDWHHPDAVSLRDAMVAEIRHRYADRISDPRQRSPQTAVAPENVAYTALAYRDGTPIGHVSLRHHFGDIELKRMYVTPAARGTGAAAALLSAAESAARAAGAPRIVLHTGDRQPEAVRLYQRHGAITSVMLRLRERGVVVGIPGHGAFVPDERGPRLVCRAHSSADGSSILASSAVRNSSSLRKMRPRPSAISAST